MATPSPDKPAADHGANRDDVANEPATLPPGATSEPEIPKADKAYRILGREERNRPEGWKFRVEIATLFFVALYTGITFWQLLVSRDALRTAQDASAASDRVAAASLKVAQDSLTLTRESNEMSQRSWIVATGLRTPQTIAPGVDRLRMAIVIQNLGKVPALKLTFIGPNQQFMTKLPPRFYAANPEALFSDKDDVESAGVLAPGAPMDILFHIGPFTERRIADIKSNQLFFTIQGVIRYTDVFKKDRFTVFCYLFNTDHGQFFPCPGANAAP